MEQSGAISCEVAAKGIVVRLTAVGFLALICANNAFGQSPNDVKFTTLVVKEAHPAARRNNSMPVNGTSTEIENIPATTYYTTRVQKVPNTTHYAPYKSHTPSMVHNELRMPPHASPLLTGQVGEQEDLNDGVYRGYGQTADDMLSSAATLGLIKTAMVSSGSFHEWIERQGTGLTLRNLPAAEVVVVRGKYDHAGHVLDQCGIPFISADGSKLKEKLTKALVLIVNCPGTIDYYSFDDIRDFVNRGGYLMTTDWALDGCLQNVCPGYAYWDGAYSNSEIVDAVRVLPQNELLKGTVALGPWKLDDKSQIVKPGNKKAVELLFRSRRLSKEDPGGLGILALTFRFGKGRVLHLVGHFDNNTNMAFANALPDPAPQIRISLRQALALNFVLEALKEQTK